MTVILGWKAFGVCQQCGKSVQLNKVIGSLHFCVSDCEKAGRHLAVREESRGRLRKRTWRVCDGCGEERISGDAPHRTEDGHMSELRGMYDQPGVPDVQSGVALGVDGPPDFPEHREPKPVDREAVLRLLRLHGVTSGRSYNRQELSRYREDLADAVLALIGGPSDPQA